MYFPHDIQDAAAVLDAVGFTDLVEALEALDASWAETFPDGPDGPDGDYDLVSIGDEHREIWSKARSALCKAKGEPA